jgi:protein SCO1/2
MSAFDPMITALRVTLAETDAAVKAFKAYNKKVPLYDGGYTMDHTAGIIPMDTTGKFAGKIDSHEPKATQIAKLQRLISAAGKDTRS